MHIYATKYCNYQHFPTPKLFNPLPIMDLFIVLFSCPFQLFTPTYLFSLAYISNNDKLLLI